VTTVVVSGVATARRRHGEEHNLRYLVEGPQHPTVHGPDDALQARVSPINSGEFGSTVANGRGRRRAY
jgi:hypothetical protein